MKELSFLIFTSLLLIYSCKHQDTAPGPISGAAVVPIEKEIDLDRFEEEILAFEKEDSINGVPQDEILFVGSSSIRLWSSLKEDMAPYPVLNRGFGGSTIPEVIHYSERIVFKYNPRLIVFYCGENDIAAKSTPLQVFRSYKSFVGMVQEKLPQTKIIFISMKPSMRRWAFQNKITKGNEMIRTLSDAQPMLEYVDVKVSMLTPEGIPDTSIFVVDSLHMNARGYERWTSLIRPLVEQNYTLQ